MREALFLIGCCAIVLGVCASSGWWKYLLLTSAIVAIAIVVFRDW